MMDRLQKRCLIGSLAVHALLVIVLVIGPAFVQPRPPATPQMPLLTFIPSRLVDDLVSGGGRPGPLPPAPRIVSPRPQPAAPADSTPPPPEPPRTAPKRSTPRVPKPQPEERTRSSTEPEFDLSKLKKVVRSPRDTTEDSRRAKVREAEAARAAARATAQAQARREAYSGALNSLRHALSGETPVGEYGEGGTGGPAVANYFQAILTIYDDAWVEPADVTDESLVVVTRIVIARSGEVVSKRIITPSGNRSLDASVRQVLDEITNVPRFPEGARDVERSYTIKFKVKPR